MEESAIVFEENGNPETTTATESSISALEDRSKINEAELLKQLTNAMLTSPQSLNNISGAKPPKNSKEDYKFWKTQPVPDIGVFNRFVLIVNVHISKFLIIGR